jgi:hypothetical protein
MSDLGSIARSPELTVYGITGPGYAGGTIAAPLAQNGSLSGTVTVGVTPVNGAKLYLYWRQSMQMVARTFTDAAGDYSFTGLPPSATNGYAIVVFDPEGGTVYNDHIKSLLTPG